MHDKVIILEGSEKFLKDALKISIKYNISVYDSLFLALTKFLNAKLITGDRQQNEVACEIGLLSVYIE